MALDRLATRRTRVVMCNNKRGGEEKTCDGFRVQHTRSTHGAIMDANQIARQDGV